MNESDQKNSDNFPFETEHKFLPSDLESLQNAIKLTERELTGRQIRFARNMAALPRSVKQAAIDAGYSQFSASQRATQLVNNSTVVWLIECLKRADQLNNGLPASYKRGHLVKMIDNPATRNSDRNSSLKLLSELDGDLRPEDQQGATIVVHMPFSGGVTDSVTIESEPVETPALDLKTRGGEGR